ncbi:reverse transcriptase [Phytophthora megakarya]|uniref:Reverse transcriptase n=1 Tax=Phytophthora megakarya TaxID=4795 RepID=A0A225VA22_9STRA|nr:reverse transcriptase [Phytophthora megakarya]
MPDQTTDRSDTKDTKTENQTDVGNTEPKTENLNCQTQIKLDTGEVAAEDLEGNLTVLPEIPISTTAKVSIEDLQVGGDSRSATPEEIERLRQIIWKKRHLLIGKGNALPPAAKGVVYDSDGGNAKPTANPESAHANSRNNRSPDQGPPGSRDHPTLDIAMGLTDRDCSQEQWCGYQVVHRLQVDKQLTRLMGYPMSLISDLLEDLDKALDRVSYRRPDGNRIDPSARSLRTPAVTMKSMPKIAFCPERSPIQMSKNTPDIPPE